MKTRLPILWIVVVAACISIIVILNKALVKTRDQLDSERHKRFVAEEQLERSKTQMNKLGASLRQTEKRLEDIQENLQKEKSAFQKLKSEFNHVVEVKQELENNMQKALTPAQDSDSVEEKSGHSN